MIFILFDQLFLALLGLCFCAGFYLAAGSRSYSIIAVHRLLTAVTSLVAAHGLWGTRALTPVVSRLQSTGSVVVVHGLSCSTTCGVFMAQGYNPCLLHWQVDSLPLSHQGSLREQLFYYIIYYMHIYPRWQLEIRSLLHTLIFLNQHLIF